MPQSHSVPLHIQLVQMFGPLIPRYKMGVPWDGVRVSSDGPMGVAKRWTLHKPSRVICSLYCRAPAGLHRGSRSRLLRRRAWPGNRSLPP
jgi:hypothetical protein